MTPVSTSRAALAKSIVVQSFLPTRPVDTVAAWRSGNIVVGPG